MLSPKPKSRPLAIVAATPPSRPPSMKLRACFERWYLPELTKDRTIETFECALRLWEKLTGDPDIDKITDETLILFRDRLLAMGRRPATVNKYRGHLLAILRRLGPQCPGNWAGQGILKRVPFIRKLAAQPIPKRTLSLDDLSAWYIAAQHARWPETAITTPAEFWRVLICLVYNAAPRKGDVLALRWDDVDFAQGVVRFTARKTEKRQAIPLNAVLRSHLEKIRGTHELVFPAPYCPWYMAREAKRMQTAGGHRDAVHDSRSAANVDHRLRPVPAGPGESSADTCRSQSPRLTTKIPSARWGRRRLHPATRRLPDDRRRTRRGRTHSAADRRPVDE